MLTPSSCPAPSDIARHYDELHFFYRHLWGDHLHHGVWDGVAERSSIAAATTRLLELATAPLHLQPGQSLLDIGCGYGADARWIAQEFGVHVTGLTLSPRQVAVAQAQPPPTRGLVTILHRDWLANRLPDQSFHAAIAVESLAHMPDKPAFFRELARTLAPGGRAAIACWTAAPDLSLLERFLLRRICREGRLPSLGTLDEYLDLATSAGLHITGHRDLTREVEPTWWLIARRSTTSLVTSPYFPLAGLRCTLRHPTYLRPNPQMLFAYRTGALQYHLFWLKRPTG